MNIGRNLAVIKAVLVFCLILVPLQLNAEKPSLSLNVDGLENVVLEEVAPDDYRLLFEGEPLEQITGAEFPALRNMEIKLQNQRLKAKTEDRSVNALLIAMARIADPATLTYLHQLYESYPERRDDVAEAISWYARENQRRDADWRILVRSLNVVEGDQAKAVMQALAKFHRRSNKSQWIRQAILVGLEQDRAGQKIASELLQHWTGLKEVPSSDNLQNIMLAWQEWFAKKYPEELPAVLPTESSESRWKYQTLLKDLQQRPRESFDTKLGEKAFVKANCVKCHQYGKIGEKVGPDLTHVSRRMQRKEIVRATLFPSHFVSEEYPTFTIITDSGKTWTGMMGAAGAGEIMLLTGEGKKQLIQQKEVDEIIPVKKSSMPDGLLNLLSKEEVLQLFGYLTTLPEGASEAYRHTLR